MDKAGAKAQAIYRVRVNVARTQQHIRHDWRQLDISETCGSTLFLPIIATHELGLYNIHINWPVVHGESHENANSERQQEKIEILSYRT